MFPLSDSTYARMRYQGPYAEPGYPFYPLNSPGMPMPGATFVAAAKQYGDDTTFVGKGTKIQVDNIGHQLGIMYFQATYDPYFRLPVLASGKINSCRFIPGNSALTAVQHVREFDRTGDIVGPRPAPVMLIGKWPSREEAGALLNMVGPAYEHVWDVCEDLGLAASDLSNWYVTSLVKFLNPDQNKTSFPKAWVSDCLPILHQELRIVRPRYILCFGADVSRVITAMSPEAPQGLGDDAMRGRVLQIRYPISLPGEKLRYNVAQVMSIIHPAKVHHAPELKHDLRRGMRDFVKLVKGHAVGGDEEGLDHRIIDNEDDLRKVVDEMLATTDPLERLIAVDAEWQGQKPFDKGAYLRTVQFSNKPKFAVCVKICHAGGAPAFYPNIDAAKRQLERLFLDPRSRIGGHFLRSDIPWIDKFLGIDLRPKYRPAKTPDLCLTEGGWETSLAEHALNETGLLGLEVLRAKYTTVPAYEALLDKWLKRYCAERGIEKSEIEGFGDWDGPDFYKYACYDADTTVRIIRRLFEILPRDRHGINCVRPYWTSHSASLAVLEMEEHGIVPDAERALELSNIFTEARNILVSRLRQMIRWPTFNPNSDIQCRGMLFGDYYSKKPGKPGYPDIRPTADETSAEAVARVERAIKANEIQLTSDGRIGSIYSIPYGAISQNLTPITATGKKPLAWEKVVMRNEEHLHTPSTGREVLGILSHTNQAATVLRDIRYLTKALQTVLRQPQIDEDTNEYETSDEGNYVFEKGLLSYICSDGRIHTRLKQTMETGRASSSKPALQNLCFDAETEVLTRRGWIPITNVVMSDEVAQFRKETEGIEFVNPTALYDMPYDGDMLHFTGEQVDLMLTPNHRCLFQRRRSGNWLECEASQWPSRDAESIRIMHAGHYDGGASSLQWARVAWLCAVQADGCYAGNGYSSNSGISFAFSKARKQRRLRLLLSQLGASYTETTVDGVVKFYVGATDNETLVRFAKDKLGPNKTFGAWLLDYDNATLRLFADEFVLWDGLSTRQSEYSSSVEVNADWAQIVWTLVSTRARKRVYRPANPSAALHYCVDVPQPHVRRNFTGIGNVTCERVSGVDRVYCLSVPSTYVVVRRNGKVAVTGNSNRREDDFKMILGYTHPEKGHLGRYKDWITTPLYNHSQRTIFRAAPGCVLMESDYTGAELAGIMWMAQDPQGMEDVRCNLLPESHPDFRDIHANMAIKAFHLDCKPTKKALADLGKAGLRVAAKNIIFGVPYGRGAEAIARQCREEGVNITTAEAQTIIDYYFTRYSKVAAFLDECKACVANPGYMIGCFGRVRRFDWTSDPVVRGEQERQAGNFRIQNLVADAVWTALNHMYDYRASQKIDFKFTLQIHDAIMLEVPFHSVPRVYREVFPVCMNEMVEIWPCNANGVRLPLDKPYHLGGSREIMFRWGEDVEDMVPEYFGKDAPKFSTLLEDPSNDERVVEMLQRLEAHA